jgi:hypothetical protein
VEDGIQTWHVSEIDKKGKRKKGTLGIGSGAVFFASEADKVSLLSNGKVLPSYHTYLDSGSEMAN